MFTRVKLLVVSLALMMSLSLLSVPAASNGAPPPQGVFNLVVLGDQVFLSATDDVHGRELWTSDGTPEGTTIVKDIKPNGSSDAGYAVDGFAVVGDTLYFHAKDGIHGRELWKSDGTKAGTRIVKNITRKGSSWIAELTAVGNRFFFSYNSDKASTPGRLWKSNGTARGTVRVKNDGVSPTWPQDLAAFGNRVFFSAERPGEGRELWKSNGKRRGTKLVKNIRKGNLQSRPREFTAGDSILYFVANDGFKRFNNTGIWKTDGTRVGTRYVKNVDPFRDMWDDPPYPEELTTIGDRLFFVDQDCTHGYELWTSDATTDGTVIIDIQPGEVEGHCGSGSGPTDLTVFQGKVYFSARYMGSRGLWRSDGTEAGTDMIKDLANSSGFPGPFGLTVGGDTLFFIMPGSTAGYELWKSDGTEAGTVKVADVQACCSYPRELTPAGDLLFFIVGRGELWRSDGTPEGTGPVSG